MSSKPGNATVVSTSTQPLGAIATHITNSKPAISVNGITMRRSDIVAVYQDGIDTRAAVNSAKGKYKEALAARTNAEAHRLFVDGGLKAYVLNRFGTNSQAAHDFGFAARKAPVTTVESKMHAKLQNKATREARGTVGPKKKLAIKGVVPTDATAAPTVGAVLAAPAGLAPRS